MADDARSELVALIRREARGAEEIADAILHPLNRDLLRRAVIESEGEPTGPRQRRVAHD